MTRADKLVVATGALAWLLMTGYAIEHLRISTDITHFIPAAEDQQLAEISQQLTTSALARTMILSVGAPKEGEALEAVQALAKALCRSPAGRICRTGPAEGFAESAYSVLFPHRYQLLFDQPEQSWPHRLSSEGIATAAVELRRQLALPTGLLVKRIAGSDPLLTFPTLLDRLNAANSGSLTLVNRQYMTADHKHAILFIETTNSPFDGATQAPLISEITKEFARINSSRGGGLTLEQSGLNRFAAESERVIHQDIDRISSLSTLAIVLLLLLLFRSVRVVLLSFIPLLFGLSAGVAISVAIFGVIHGLTLAFGATLIGVCVDYPIHFLNHHALRPASTGPRGTRRRIAWALTLGAATTLAGFVGLGMTSFPGMRELAVFSGAGIVAAFAATYWLLPPLSVYSPRQVALHQALAQHLGHLVEALRRRRDRLVVVPLIALLLCAAGLPRVRWSDDLNDLNRLNVSMRTEDERVRAEVSRMDSSRLVIAVAPDDARALAINDRVFAALTEARRSGELSEIGSLHDLIFSEGLQRRNLESVKADPTSPRRVVEGLSAGGFRPEAFAAFLEFFSRPSPPPLTMADVMASPLGDLVRPFRVELGHQVGLLTLLRGVVSPSAVSHRIAQIGGAYYFDQRTFLSRVYGRYRRRTIEVVLAGILGMFAIVFLKYRRIRPTLAAGLPALLAAASTIALLGLLGIVTNLLHVVSLLFVLSAAEDYAVFLLESAATPSYLSASAVSILICCFATVLGFGLLGLSAMPALAAVGVTTGIGVVISLLLAPTALLLVPRRGDL